MDPRVDYTFFERQMANILIAPSKDCTKVYKAYTKEREKEKKTQQLYLSIQGLAR